MAVHDLCFGFVLEFSELFAQTRDGLLQLLDVKFEGINLLTQSRMVNTDFAGRIQ